MTTINITINWTLVLLAAVYVLGIATYWWYTEKFGEPKWETIVLFRDEKAQIEGFSDAQGTIIKSWLINHEASPIWAGKLPVGFKTRVKVHKRLDRKHYDFDLEAIGEIVEQK